MNPVLDFSPTFRRSLRYIEWLLVAAFLLVYGLDPQFNDSPIEVLATIAGALGLVGLSWKLPTHHPVWQRQIYLLMGILLSLFIRSVGLDWDLFLYFYIAKSCFLLERRSLSVTIIGITLLSILLFYWTRSSSPEVWQWTLQYAVTYFAILAFVVYLSRVIITEQRSRHRAEVLAQQVETLAATLERTRIARDIHDSLGHLLTDLNARLAVAQALRDRDPHEASQAVDMAKLLASESIAEVKRSLQIIRRSDFNLNEALTTLMEQLRYNQNLSVQWSLNLPPLPLSTSHHIYCIVKEGLINIQKHSQASEVHLRSQFTDQELYLDLEDNGQGFDPAYSHDGFGLKGMAERVQLLSGKLTINSTVGSGTQIRLTIPL
jgi:signal transduction histidine kinase